MFAYKIPLSIFIFSIPLVYTHAAYTFTPGEEQAIIDSLRQTSPGVTTTMNPGNAVIATMAEREALIQKNVSLGLSYAEATSKVDSYYQGGDNGPKKIIVTEEIPGSSCVCIAEDNCVNAGTKKFECTVEATGLSSFQKLVAAITKWFVYITMLFGVLALVGAGILWAWGSESEEYTKKAKGWAINIIIGLAILFTFRYILGFLAPWIFM